MLEASPKKNIISEWVSWQFYYAPKNIIKAFRNFLKFNINFFSIPLLFKTLLSYWHNYRDFYGRGFDFKRYAWVFMSNMVSRVFGALVRIVTIMIGLSVEVILFIVGIIAVIAWIATPILLLLGLYFGIGFLI